MNIEFVFFPFNLIFSVIYFLLIFLLFTVHLGYIKIVYILVLITNESLRAKTLEVRRTKQMLTAILSKRTLLSHTLLRVSTARTHV